MYQSSILLFLGHRNLIKNKTQTYIYINSSFKFQRLLLKMYVEYIRNVKS